jgi:hypothetical protein
MKKYLFIILATALFLGCSKKESTAPPSFILGKWNITADTARVDINGTVTQTSVLKESVGPYVTFNANGNGVIMRDTTGAGATLVFNYIISGDIITFSYPAQTYHGEQLPAVGNSASINQLASGTLGLVFATTQQNAGATEIDYEVMYIHQ